MSTLLEKQITVNQIVTINHSQARAIEIPARTAIIKALYNKPMNAEQIAGELEKSGIKKALSTIRHHLDVLKDAGLIDIVKIEETRGAITKYYGTTARISGYNAPEDFDTKYSSVIMNVAKKLDGILQNLAPKAAPNAAKQKSAPMYSPEMKLEIVNRAMVQVMEREDERKR